MKKIVLALVAVAAFAGSAFSHATVLNPASFELSCHSRHVADAGYSVVIEALPAFRPGRLPETRYTARLYQITFAGSKLIGETRVERTENSSPKHPRIRSYVSNDLTVQVNLDAPIGGVGNIFQGHISGNSVGELFTDMTCQVASAQIEQPTNPGPFIPRPTCMAYFSGAFFSVEKMGCVQFGKSGCSNPFEFRDVNSCNQAYSLK